MWTDNAYEFWQSHAANPASDPPSSYEIATPQDQADQPKRLLTPFWVPLLQKDDMPIHLAEMEKKMKQSKEDTSGSKVEDKIVLDALYHHSSASGHTVLVEFLFGKDNGRKAVVYDSAQDFLQYQRAYGTAVRRLGQDCRWGQTKAPPRAVQMGHKKGEACTLHAIITAWVRALGLRPESNFRGNEDKYREAVQMVNLALAGYMDSATIYAWLRCREIANARHSYKEANHFLSTWAVKDESTFEIQRQALLEHRSDAEPERRPSTDSVGPSLADEADDEHKATTIAAYAALLTENLECVRREDMPVLFLRFRQGQLDNRFRLRARLK